MAKIPTKVTLALITANRVPPSKTLEKALQCLLLRLEQKVSTEIVGLNVVFATKLRHSFPIDTTAEHAGFPCQTDSHGQRHASVATSGLMLRKIQLSLAESLI
jgi:hypothetical protein